MLRIRPGQSSGFSQLVGIPHKLDDEKGKSLPPSSGSKSLHWLLSNWPIKVSSTRKLSRSQQFSNERENTELFVRLLKGFCGQFWHVSPTKSKSHKSLPYFHFPFHLQKHNEKWEKKFLQSKRWREEICETQFCICTNNKFIDFTTFPFAPCYAPFIRKTKKPFRRRVAEGKSQ